MPAVDITDSNMEDLLYHLIHKINRDLDDTITIDELRRQHEGNPC